MPREELEPQVKLARLEEEINMEFLGKMVRLEPLESQVLLAMEGLGQQEQLVEMDRQEQVVIQEPLEPGDLFGHSALGIPIQSVL